MAILKPFKAWRPKTEFALDIACVPYDVINTQEARELAQDKNNSFLHIIRPEIDLPANVSIYDSKVYEQGKKNLDHLLNSEFYIQEDENALYLYRLIMDGRSQTGIYGCVSVDDYNNNVILKHEKTRPDKEDDRTRHIMTQQAHAEPVMMTFSDSGRISSFMKKHMEEHPPLYDFETEDGITHSIWKIENPDFLVDEFKSISKIYIADGHHRCASAARTAAEMNSKKSNHSGEEEYNFFPAVLFPMDEMNILAYNRIIYSVPDDFMRQLEKNFSLKKHASPVPSKKGDLSIYFEDNWYGITLQPTEKTDPASALDVALLHEQILQPILGIKNQRTDSNIDFVGGIKGTDELEKLVDNGEAALAISLYPTHINELVEVSDAGLLMPPKSTWFEPKLRSGLLVHTF